MFSRTAKTTSTVDRIADALGAPRNYLGKTLNAEEPCGAHDRWVATLDAAWNPFRTTTLADLLADVERPMETDS